MNDPSRKIDPKLGPLRIVFVITERVSSNISSVANIRIALGEVYIEDKSGEK